MIGEALKVWHGLTRSGRCQRCGQGVLWAVTKAGTWLPLSATAVRLRIDRDPDRGTTFDVYDWSAVHPKNCTKKATA